LRSIFHAVGGLIFYQTNRQSACYVLALVINSSAYPERSPGYIRQPFRHYDNIFRLQVDECGPGTDRHFVHDGPMANVKLVGNAFSNLNDNSDGFSSSNIDRLLGYLDVYLSKIVA